MSHPLMTPEIEQACNLVPHAVAQAFKILPLSGHMPHSDRFHDTMGLVRLLCAQQLTETQRVALYEYVPCFSREFIDPDHLEFRQYAALVEAMPELLRYHYPEELPAAAIIE